MRAVRTNGTVLPSDLKRLADDRAPASGRGTLADRATASGRGALDRSESLYYFDLSVREILAH